jgi:two-component system copper resistance phosphate regulon response regulator CusR
MNVLLVEDTEKMSRFIEEGLTDEGYKVDIAKTGKRGEELGCTNQYEVIILDIMLPDIDGVQVCRNLRKSGIQTPIVMLTALSGIADKVAGLDAGADDYLTKPFELVELMARVRAKMRRGQTQEVTTLRFEDIELDLLSRKAKRAGKEVRLTSREFTLLEYFVRHPNQVLNRTSISQTVWEMNFDNESNVIDVYVSMLRRKIDRGYPTKLIHTVVGEGYMLSTDPSSTS